MPSPPNLDRFDVQLLDALQHDCRTAAETLGARLGLSATAVQRRIRRLKEAYVLPYHDPDPRVARAAAGAAERAGLSRDILDRAGMTA